MISISEVSMSFAGQILFENVNAVFNSGERYGLTGQWVRQINIYEDRQRRHRSRLRSCKSSQETWRIATGSLRL